MNFINWLKAQGDRVAGWAGIAVGGVMILAGWITTSGTRTVSDQIPYLVSAGLGGLFFVAIGVAMLVRADLHDEWSKLDSVEQALRSQPSNGGERVVELRDRPATSARSVDVAGHGARRAEPVLAVSDSPGNGAASQLAIRQEALSVAVALVGALSLLWGWFAVSGTRHVPVALNDSALAVIGLAVVAAAGGLNSFGLRRQVARRTAQLLGPLGPVGGAPAAEVDDAATRGQYLPPPTPGDGRRYVVDGSTRYHRQDCRVLATQQPAAVHPATTTAGLTACRLCEAATSDA